MEKWRKTERRESVYWSVSDPLCVLRVRSSAEIPAGYGASGELGFLLHSLAIKADWPNYLSIHTALPLKMDRFHFPPKRPYQ